MCKCVTLVANQAGAGTLRPLLVTLFCLCNLGYGTILGAYPVTFDANCSPIRVYESANCSQHLDFKVYSNRLCLQLLTYYTVNDCKLCSSVCFVEVISGHFLWLSCQAIACLVQGKRYSLANSRIMIHQPLGGAQGQAADIEIQANEILHHKLTLNGYLAEFTGQGMERITQDTGQYICPAG